MKILVTGSGSSAGSYPIRAEQLGAAIGATVIPKALDAKGYDVAVLVKRKLPATIAAIRKAGAPLVWDIVDSWPQPVGNSWTRDVCIQWLRGQVAEIRPDALVAATHAMRRDCEEFGLPVLALPHHARQRQARNPIRETVRVVGYEGSERHLGDWRPWLDAECARRRWLFVVNPPALSGVDILVALRERTGYAPRHWKSNVKMANAQATGTPIVCGAEAGYVETCAGGALFADTYEEVARAFDELGPAEVRRSAASRLLSDAPTLRGMAAVYRDWLEEEFACSTAQRS